jgi:myosin heavy subunit
MDTLGFLAVETASMWRIVAAILHLGNTRLRATASEQAEFVSLDGEKKAE